MTGEAAGFGEEARAATRLYLDEGNAAGGVDGHPVVLQTFDDRSRPAVAGSNVPAVLDSPAVAVLGHPLSAASVTAEPGYKAGRIPALTGNASADEVTQGNPYYFRALSPNTRQAAFLAEHVRTVMLGHDTAFLRSPDIELVSSEAPYGRSFRAGFASGNGGSAPKVFHGGAWRDHRADRGRGRRPAGPGAGAAHDRHRRRPRRHPPGAAGDPQARHPVADHPGAWAADDGFAAQFAIPSTLAKERTTIPVTGILTSAVLLISISNQLPALGYTVALEYLFTCSSAFA